MPLSCSARRGALALLVLCAAGALSVGPAASPTHAVEPALSAWHAALDGAATAPADVLFIGDSITEGYGAPDTASWWVDQARSELQSDWGGAGFGYRPSAPGTITAIPDIWSAQGAPAVTDSGLGLRARVLADAQARLSATVTGDGFRLFHAVGPDKGAMEVSIDGSAVATVDTYATDPSTDAWSSGPLTRGQHTISLRSVDTGRVQTHAVTVQGIMVYDGDADRGVRVWDSGHSGYGSAHFAGGQGWDAGAGVADPELLVIALGTNDYTFQTSTADFERNLIDIIDRASARADGPMSVVLMPMFLVPGRDAERYRGYVDVQLRLAHERGFAIVDLSGLDTTAITDDRLHPNAAGQDVLAEAFLQIVNPHHTASPLVPDARPADATAVSIAPASTTTARLTFTAPAGPVSDYLVLAYDLTDRSVTAHYVTSSPGTVSGLDAGHRYVFGIHARNAAGRSTGVASNVITLPTPSITKPANPTAVSIAAASSSTAQLTFTAPAGPVTDYLVLAYDLTDGSVTAHYVTSSPGTVSGLDAGHRYVFGIHARNAAGHSIGVATNVITLPS